MLMSRGIGALSVKHRRQGDLTQSEQRFGDRRKTWFQTYIFCIVVGIHDGRSVPGCSDSIITVRGSRWTVLVCDLLNDLSA